MKQAKRIVAMVLCLLALLALPAGAVMEKGEPNITAQTTMKEVRSNPGIKNSGFYTYSQDKDCPPGQALWEMTTVEGYTNEYVAEGCAKGLNLVIENYNNGVQVTHSIYTDAEKAADRTKNNTGLFYFPAKAENAKFALILAGSGNSDSAITVLGLFVGAAFCHNFKLASSAEGPTPNGKIAVIVGLVVVAVVAFVNIQKQKKNS